MVRLPDGSDVLSVIKNASAKIIVVFVLAAVGWFGHTYHWTIPGLTDSEPNDPTTLRTSARRSTASEIRVSLEGLIDDLPAVEFDSLSAVKNCGIEIGAARRQELVDYVTANGVVGYDQTHLAQLSVRVPGTVWRVEKRLGAVVERGDILAIVDSAEVGEAKARLLEASAVHNLKTQNLRRLEEVQTIVTGRDLREAKAALEVARTQLFNALQKLVTLGFPLGLEDVSQLPVDKLADKLRLLGLPPELENETQSANLIPITAPFSGVVTACEIVRGETVDPSKAQYVVADLHRIWINLDVRQEDGAKLFVGAPVEFQGERGVSPVKGTLTWIGPEIDSRTRTVRARVEADNPVFEVVASSRVGSTDRKAGAPSDGGRRRLQIGMFGTARINIGVDPAAVFVPNEALHFQWELEREVVFVPNGKGTSFHPRVVKKGLVRGDDAQIIEGMAAGEPVVISGSRILSSELSELLRSKLSENASAVRGFNLPSTNIAGHRMSETSP